MEQYDTPAVEYGFQRDYIRLWKSNPDHCLTLEISLQAGYGIVRAGTGLAINLSAGGGKDKYIPYCPTTFPATQDPGRAYLVADTGIADAFVYVTMEDSYKFQVGDDLIINDNITAPENKGAITAIDRTSEPHRAKISFTTVIGGTAFTAARKGYVIVEAGTVGNLYSDCIGILMKSVNTGSGEKAKGAGAQLILAHALLYEGSCLNIDAAAKTAISASSKGQYLMIR